MARATRIALDIALSTSKALKPLIGTSWQYAKVEMIPPMTSSIFQGALGERIESTVSRIGDGFISAVQQKIRDIEAEEARVIREKEAAIKAAAEKAKAEALKKAEEQKRLQAEKAAKEAKEAEKKKAEAPKADAKAASTSKAQKPEEKPKTAKSDEKKAKPEDKKGSPPAKK